MTFSFPGGGRRFVLEQRDPAERGDASFASLFCIEEKIATFPSTVAAAPKPPVLPAESKPKLQKKLAKIDREAITIATEAIFLRA